MLFVLGNKYIRFMKRVEFSNVKNLQVGLDEANDASTMADGEVEIDDAEAIGEAIHQRKQTGGEAVDATEREGVEFRGERGVGRGERNDSQLIINR